MDWFRFYSDALHSKKLTRAAMELNIPYCYALGYWSAVLCLGNESPIRGYLMLTEKQSLDIVDIAGAFRADEATTQAVLDVFTSKELLEKVRKKIHIVGWNDRQKESDSSTNRVRKHRDLRSKCNVTETLQKRDGNAPEAEQIRAETEAEAEQSNSVDWLARSQSLYCDFVQNGNLHLSHKNRDHFKAIYAELPGKYCATTGTIYNVIHDFFKGYLPQGREPTGSITPYAQWQMENPGEKLGVALLRIKIEDALKYKQLWSQKIRAGKRAAA
jgi:hypothetical protein